MDTCRIFRQVKFIGEDGAAQKFRGAADLFRQDGDLFECSFVCDTVDVNKAVCLTDVWRKASPDCILDLVQSRIEDMTLLPSQTILHVSLRYVLAVATKMVPMNVEDPNLQLAFLFELIDQNNTLKKNLNFTLRPKRPKQREFTVQNFELNDDTLDLLDPDHPDRSLWLTQPQHFVTVSFSLLAITRHPVVQTV